MRSIIVFLGFLGFAALAAVAAAPAPAFDAPLSLAILGLALVLLGRARGRPDL